MSGGASGLSGYVYQQDYLAFRALASAAAKALGDGTLRPIESFSIEGRTSADGPAWDLILCDALASVELRECKNTNITKEDREIFYKRVRKEVHSGTSPESLMIGWVTDAEKQDGNILAHLAGIGAVLDAGAHQIPDAPPARVDSAQAAVLELPGAVAGGVVPELGLDV